MSIYTNGIGKQVDTSTMVIEYINAALAKAKKENNQDNITALEEEIKKRNG